MSPFSIEHDIDNHLFYTIVDGQTARLSYQPLPDNKTLDYQSTFVPPDLRSRRIGYYLVEFALNYAKDNGFKVIPSCWFVAKYLDNHPEFDEVRAN